MLFSIMFPPISPVAVSLGFFDVRWYSLSYIIGALLAFIYVKFLNKEVNIISQEIKVKFFDDVLFFIILGVLLGGRLGFVIFYGFYYYIQNPLEIFFLWEGGMSYHGGLIGVILSSVFIAKKYNKSLLEVTDIIIPGIPIGLFLGRLANFVNAELYGKPTDLPWGVVFPDVYLPRHPSQLYEAFLEGIVIFFILSILWKKKMYERNGYISGAFLFLYGIFRIFVEFFRAGEIYFFNLISMGQILSFPMVLVGMFLLYNAKRKNYKTY